MWIRVFFALIFSSFILINGYASDFVESSDLKITPRQLIVQNSPRPDESDQNLLKNILGKEKSINDYKTLKDYADTYFKFSFFICEDPSRLGSYLKLIDQLASPGTRDEETLENYLEAATHLQKAKRALEMLKRKHSVMEDLPEFQVKIQVYGEDEQVEIDLDEKIYTKIYDLLEARFLKALSDTKTISDIDKFITDFLESKENKRYYSAIKHVYGGKISNLWEKHTSDHKDKEEFDFSDSFY